MPGEELVVAGGIVHAGFAVFHLAFWRIFNWRSALQKLDRVNAALMQILNLRLIWIFVVFACVAFAYPAQLAGTPLGRALLLGIAAFWAMRAVEQVVFFRLRHPASLILFCVFVAAAGLHAAALLG